jgi:hypothetical protein
MSFFYDLNKKLDGIRATPEVTHKQLNEGVMDTVKTVGKKVASGINQLVGHGSDKDMIIDLQRRSGAPVTGKKPVPPQQVKEKLSPAKQKSFAALAPPTDKITFADKIAGAKKEVDEMLGDVAAEAMRNALGKGKQTVQGMSEDQPTHFEVHYKDNQKGRTAKTKVKGSDAKQAKAAWNDWNSSNTPGRFTFVAVKPVSTEMDEDNAFDYKTPRSMKKGEKKASSTGGEIYQKDDKTVVHTAGRHYGGGDEPNPNKEKRTKAGRPDGTGKKIGAKGPSGKSKLITKVDEVDIRDQGEYDQEGDMAKDDIKTIVRHAQALSKVLGDNDNLPEWVQSKLAKIEGMMISIDEYMQNQEGDDDSEEPIAEEPRSKNQAVAARIARGVQKGTAKAKPGSASAEMAKMRPKELNKFAKGSTKGLPDKVKSKKKEKDVEESTTSGSVATSTATTGSKGGVFGKGIYDSMNRELENMIAESMSINMSDSTEGNKSLTVTATDDDAMKLAMMLKSAGVGGHDHDMHSGMAEAVDENSPDWPTNTEQANNNFGYAGGQDGPKSTGQSTVPVLASQDERQHSYAAEEEDAIKRMMEMAGLAEGNMPMVKKDGKMVPAFAADGKGKNDLEAKDKEEDTVEESIRRMMEIAGVKKKPMDEQKTEEGNLFTKGLEDDDVKNW